MTAVDENWGVLLSVLPPRWQEHAVETGAVARLRGFPSSEALLRTLLLHIGRGHSLRETALRAKLADWANVSDVALLKRLRSSEDWLRTLCSDLLRENGVALEDGDSAYHLRIVDGTVVKEPGKTGSQWRIMYSLQLPTLACDFFDLTPAVGKGNGESLRRLPVAPGQLILGDAGYCSNGGIEHVHQNGADVLVRVNPATLSGYSAEGKRVDLLELIRNLSEAGQIGEWPIVVKGQQESVSGRLCAIRKSEQAIAAGHRRIQLKAKRQNTKTKAETWEFAKYVAVFTTHKTASASQILDWYRKRWQIELIFKRLKSLAQLGHLPKHDDRSSRAWLYGKLLVALLTQKLIRIGNATSPWGYLLESSTAQPLA